MKDLSIIIPVFNEELNIQILYEKLKCELNKIVDNYEIIFINDGSTDNSLLRIKELNITDKRVKYIDFSRNFGHQIAVMAGIDFSDGKAVIIIDADLQDPPELIVEMYNKYKSGFEVVYAKRIERKGESAAKKITASVFYRFLQKITTVNIPVDTGDFRIIDRKIVDSLKKMPEKHKFLRGQISWIGFSQSFVEYVRNERAAGKTGYSYRKMIRLATDAITSFSNFPLKFASFIGFLVSAISFILILFSLYQRYFVGDVVKGWTSTVIIVLFIGGIQLISLGIIGEYISRIYDGIRNRPLYIINETNISNSENISE